ncbi:MAG: saccharopine dehydrogenase NADP-binding domain-containing protein [Candidatus Kapabacteria bacterium]|nr:saccharopine dehydrogenase NADP-binding domain-containing protein [Candidatus Kapabacteria bacterium]
MNNKKILILGGYGAVGRRLARLILNELDANIVIAGRREDKAEEFAVMLNKEFPGKRVNYCFADASDLSSLNNAFAAVQLVLVSTTTPEYINIIAQAALESGCDYMDILVSDSVVDQLNEFASTISQRKRTFITQAGFHPGLAAVFIRYCNKYFDVYEKAIVGMAMNARFENADQAKEIIPMISEFNPEIYQSGSWRKATYKDMIEVEMNQPFGKRKLFPMSMPEIKQTQEMFNLIETGVYVSGFNWFVDYIIFPVIFLTQKIKKGFCIGILTKLFAFGVNTFSGKYEGVEFLIEAEGIKEGQRLKMRVIADYNDAYMFTAIPVVACLKQYFDGQFSPGLSMMGHIVDEKRLMLNMEEMGINISYETRI